MVKAILMLIAMGGLVCTTATSAQTTAAEKAAASSAPTFAQSPVVAPSVLSEAEAANYQLGPGDKLSVITFDEPQLTGIFAVGASGSVSLPWVGDVPASGHTEAEIRDQIVTRLKNGFILNPQVSIQVLSLRPYFILGEVNKPGQYPFLSGLTVMAAVATAEGFTYRADKKHVYIKHAGQTDEQKLRMLPATPVQVGDTVRIGERYF